MALDLVTGAQGRAVRVLDNLSTGSLDNLNGLGAEFIRGDIRDPNAVVRAMGGVERVFHLAAMISVSGSMADPVGCYEVNLMGSLQVLEAARHKGVKCVVMASSAAVYGEAELPVDEEAPLRPLSPYAASKLAMEQAGRLYADAYGLPVASLRLFNVYGPRQSPDSPYAAAIPTFVRTLLDGEPPTIYGDGHQSRDFIFVTDVVRAMLAAAECKAAGGEVFNVACGRVTTINELVENLLTLIPGSPHPRFAPRRKGDIYFSQAVVEKSREYFGFGDQVPLLEGLRQTVAWFESRT